MIILDGKKVRDKKIASLQEKIKNISLSLAVIEIGDDEATNIYINQKKIMCEKLNIKFELIKFNEDVREEEILSTINTLNKSDVTGILLQLPIPSNLNERKLINAIDYKKDIDGLTDLSIIKCYKHEEGLRPCTPEGIMDIFKAYNIPLEGKDITIIGRSLLIGRPLYNMLLECNATVTICHHQTKYLAKHTKNADIIISTTGVPNLITKDMIKDGAIIIDAGISRINGKVVGDVVFDEVSSKCSYITPVPGGCGPVTISALMENIYKAYLCQKN